MPGFWLASFDKEINVAFVPDTELESLVTSPLVVICRQITIELSWFYLDF